MAELRLERQGNMYLLEERDDNKMYIVEGKERKDCIEYKKNLATKVDNLAKERKKFDCLIQSTNQLITFQKKNIKNYRSSNNKKSKSITKILEAKLVEFGIDRAKYHGGDLEETSIIRLCQNSDNIFKHFSSKLTKSLLMMIKKRKSKTMQ